MAAKPMIPPVAFEAIQDEELRSLILEGQALGVPDRLYGCMLARSPGQAKPLLRALILSLNEGNVDIQLKEIIRILLARFAGDSYFASLRSKKALAAGLTEARIKAGCDDYEDSKLFTEAEKCALRYADQMYLDSSKVDAAFYDELKRHYSEPQIMELGAFIAFHYGMQLFMRSLGAGPPKAL